MCPHRPVRVCATRADCYVPQQALTDREARTVDVGKAVAAGKETAEAWSNVWNGKVQAYKNME